MLDPYVVAQTLLAFHGDCVTAYNYRTDLWSNDQLYSSIFKENLSAEHIIFTYSLTRGIDSYKIRLQQKGSERTEIEDNQFVFLSKRGQGQEMQWCRFHHNKSERHNTQYNCVDGACNKPVCNRSTIFLFHGLCK